MKTFSLSTMLAFFLTACWFNPANTKPSTAISIPSEGEIRFIHSEEAGDSVSAAMGCTENTSSHPNCQREELVRAMCAGDQPAPLPGVSTLMQPLLVVPLAKALAGFLLDGIEHSIKERVLAYQASHGDSIWYRDFGNPTCIQYRRYEGDELALDILFRLVEQMSIYQQRGPIAVVPLRIFYRHPAPQAASTDGFYSLAGSIGLRAITSESFAGGKVQKVFHYRFKGFNADAGSFRYVAHEISEFIWPEGGRYEECESDTSVDCKVLGNRVYIPNLQVLSRAGAAIRVEMNVIEQGKPPSGLRALAKLFGSARSDIESALDAFIDEQVSEDDSDTSEATEVKSDAGDGET